MWVWSPCHPRLDQKFGDDGYSIGILPFFSCDKTRKLGFPGDEKMMFSDFDYGLESVAKGVGLTGTWRYTALYNSVIASRSKNSSQMSRLSHNLADKQFTKLPAAKLVQDR